MTVPLTTMTSRGSLPSDLVPGRWVLLVFLFGHQPTSLTLKPPVTSFHPRLLSWRGCCHSAACLCRVSEPWEKADAESDRGAKSTTGQKHVCTRGGLYCWSWPWFFLYIFKKQKMKRLRYGPLFSWVPSELETLDCCCTENLALPGPLGWLSAKAQSSCPSKLDVGKGVSWCQQFQDL